MDALPDAVPRGSDSNPLIEGLMHRHPHHLVSNEHEGTEDNTSQEHSESFDDTTEDSDAATNTQSIHSARELPEGEDESPERAEQAKREEEEFLREQQEQVICRICFEGPGSKDDDGKDLGRLLKPCKCKGTMRYIHSGCLDAWRKHSRNSHSAVACDQCGAPYRFRSSRFVGLANSRLMLALVSICVFLLLVWFVGWVTLLTAGRFGGWGGWEWRIGSIDGIGWTYFDDEDEYDAPYGMRVLDLHDDDEDEFHWNELGFVGRSLSQMALGSGMVGLISAAASIGVAFNPIGAGRFVTGGLRDRLLGGGRAGRSRGGKNDALAVAAVVVIVAVVLAGMARALYSTYKLVRRMSRRILANAEDYIVDFYGDDEQPTDATLEREQFPGPVAVEELPPAAPEFADGDQEGHIDADPDEMPEPGPEAAVLA